MSSKMIKKLTLHIGTEKTGTTTLQHFLVDNASALLAQGIYVPSTLGSMEGPYRGNCRRLPTSFMSERNIDDFRRNSNLVGNDRFESWSAGVLSAFVDELAQVTVDHVVVSSEHLSSRLNSKEEVRRLYDFLIQHFEEIQVFVYIRRQVEAAISAYSTSLKAGVNPPHILSHKAASNYDYWSLAQRWSSSFKDFHMRIFSREMLINSDIRADFMSQLGGTCDGLELSSDTNPSIGLIAQKFLKGWNEIAPKYSSDASKINHDRVVDYLERNHSGRGQLPARGWVKEWMENFSESNAKVFHTYFAGMEGTDLFGSDYDSYPENPNMRIDDKDLIRLTLDITKELDNESD